jgi:hypothetical protein
MKAFLRELWYGEPVRVFGLLSTVGVAYVGFGSPPTWAKIAVVVINAVAGFYGFRNLTEPAHPEKLAVELEELADEVAGLEPPAEPPRLT